MLGTEDGTITPVDGDMCSWFGLGTSDIDEVEGLGIDDKAWVG